MTTSPSATTFPRPAGRTPCLCTPHRDTNGAVCANTGNTSLDVLNYGLTWTFRLRDDVTWVDVDGNEKAKCVSQDWCTAMEWMLNFHKNDAVNSTLLRQMVKGAEEYFQCPGPAGPPRPARPPGPD